MFVKCKLYIVHTAYDAALALQLGNDALEAAKIAQIAVGLL